MQKVQHSNVTHVGQFGYPGQLMFTTPNPMKEVAALAYRFADSGSQAGFRGNFQTVFDVDLPPGPLDEIQVDLDLHGSAGLVGAASSAELVLSVVESKGPSGGHSEDSGIVELGRVAYPKGARTIAVVVPAAGLGTSGGSRTLNLRVNSDNFGPGAFAQFASLSGGGGVEVSVATDEALQTFFFLARQDPSLSSLSDEALISIYNILRLIPR